MNPPEEFLDGVTSLPLLKAKLDNELANGLWCELVEPDDDNDRISVYRYLNFKNGKKRKQRLLTIAYEPFQMYETELLLGEDLEHMKKRPRKPWRVGDAHFETFHGAAARFLEKLRNLQAG